MRLRARPRYPERSRRRPVARAALPFACAIALSACSDGGAGGDGPATTNQRDSAGVAIVESSAPQWGDSALWRIADEPSIDLTTSGSGPEHEFADVSGVVRLSDGRIVVAVGRELRVFSPSGMHQLILGRAGDGPGEFRASPSLSVMRGDSVVAFDFQARRATIYAPDFSKNTIVRFEGGGYFEPDVAPEDERFLLMGVSTTANDAMPMGLRRAPVPVVRASRDGRILDTVATAAGSDMVKFESAGRTTIEQSLFNHRSHHAVSGALLVLGDARELGYEVFDSAGALVRRVRGKKDLSIPSSDVMAERKALIGSDSSAGHVKAVDAFVMSISASHRRPAYGDLVVDGTGAVWLQDFASENVAPAETGWEIFDAEGTWLGRVAIPGRFVIHQIGADWVLGVASDDAGVERVQLRSLRRP
jgi:hypothetical protein